jgi:hypothetical protein
VSKSYGTNKRKEGGVPPSFLPDLKKSVDVFTLCVIFYISEIDFQVFFLCTKNQYSRNNSNDTRICRACTGKFEGEFELCLRSRDFKYMSNSPELRMNLKQRVR